MDKVYIGKIVSTHGIKGEIKILSDFEYKDKAFVVGKKIIVDDKEYTINSYRVHKKFDMITLEGYKDINEVLFLMKKAVYMDRCELSLSDNDILDEDLLEYKVLTVDGDSGIIKEIFMASPTNKIIRVELDREVLIPLSSPMIKKIDTKNKEIIVELFEGI